MLDVIDVHLSPRHRRFRDELRRLLDSEEMAAALTEAGASAGDIDPRPVHQVLGRRGWLAPHWPVHYGGIGADQTTLDLVTEELALLGIPDSAHVNTIRNAGSYLLRAGTEAQRAAHLPPLASGQALMSVLYTEPEAGSDLAGLRTNARRVDDHWLVSGTKVYSVKTAAADYGLVAARTSRHANKLVGITLFLTRLDRPGVTVEQIDTVNAEPFYRVRFDDVEMGDGDVVGPPDGGWLVVTEALAMERVGIDFSAKARAWLARIHDEAERSGRAGDPVIRARLSELDTMVAAGRSLAWAMARKLADDDLDPAEAAMSKWYNSELGQPLAALMADVQGPAGLGGAAAQFLREAPGLTLSAGTSEMMLYVAASQFDLDGEDDDD